MALLTPEQAAENVRLYKEGLERLERDAEERAQRWAEQDAALAELYLDRHSH